MRAEEQTSGICVTPTVKRGRILNTGKKCIGEKRWKKRMIPNPEK
jgi:hypothetical protein